MSETPIDEKIVSYWLQENKNSLFLSFILSVLTITFLQTFTVISNLTNNLIYEPLNVTNINSSLIFTSIIVGIVIIIGSRLFYYPEKITAKIPINLLQRFTKQLVGLLSILGVLWGILLLTIPTGTDLTLLQSSIIYPFVNLFAPVCITILFYLLFIGNVIFNINIIETITFTKEKQKQTNSVSRSNIYNYFRKEKRLIYGVSIVIGITISIIVYSLTTQSVYVIQDIIFFTNGGFGQYLLLISSISLLFGWRFYANYTTTSNEHKQFIVNTALSGMSIGILDLIILDKQLTYLFMSEGVYPNSQTYLLPSLRGFIWYDGFVWFSILTAAILILTIYNIFAIITTASIKNKV